MKNLFLGLFLLSISFTVQADFNQAIKNYEEGNYQEAFQEFKSLAEIGNKSAQYNLGFMYLDGLGTKQDLVKAYAWIKLSDEEGEHSETQNVLQQIEKHFGPEEKEIYLVTYSEIENLYGRARLTNELIPIFATGAKQSSLAIPIETRPAEYPTEALFAGKNGWVRFEFDLDIEGKPENIKILESHPGKLFVRNSKRAIRRWRFEVTTDESGNPIPQKGLRYTMEFYVDKRVRAGSKEDREIQKSLKEKIQKEKSVILEVQHKARNGDPVMQYYYAKFANKILGESSINPTDWFYKSALQGIADSQYELALNLLEGEGCEQDKSKGINWLLKAASADLPDAQLELAKTFYKNDVKHEKISFWIEKAVQSSMRLDRQKYEVSRFIIEELKSETFAAKSVSLLSSMDKSQYANNHQFYILYAKGFALNKNFASAIDKLKIAINIHKQKFGGVSKNLQEKLSYYESKL